jgi:hypothetical protein
VVRDPYAGATGLRWWRGQLHMHTARSFDGDPLVSPLRRAALCQREGYDFGIFTDHNPITALALDAAGVRGDGGGSSGPRDAGGAVDTASVERGGTLSTAFLPLAGVESTAPGAHLGVWYFGPPASVATTDPAILSWLRHPADRIASWAATGALVCCNHPSHSSAPLAAGQVESWAGAGVPFRFLEVFNNRANRDSAGLAHNLEVWRRAITAAGPERPVWGVAADDAHGQADGGTSWVAVAAPDLGQAALRQALLAGRLYASNGPAFSSLGVSPEFGGIVARAPGASELRFVGASGAVLHATTGDVTHSVTGGDDGAAGVYAPHPADRWVRVEALDGAGRTAWSQPFWIDV